MDISPNMYHELQTELSEILKDSISIIKEIQWVLDGELWVCPKCGKRYHEIWRNLKVYKYTDFQGYEISSLEQAEHFDNCPIKNILERYEEHANNS